MIIGENLSITLAIFRHICQPVPCCLFSTHNEDLQQNLQLSFCKFPLGKIINSLAAFSSYAIVFSSPFSPQLNLVLTFSCCYHESPSLLLTSHSSLFSVLSLFRLLSPYIFSSSSPACFSPPSPFLLFPAITEAALKGFIHIPTVTNNSETCQFQI